MRFGTLFVQKATVVFIVKEQEWERRMGGFRVLDTFDITNNFSRVDCRQDPLIPTLEGVQYLGESVHSID
jgi:hypothetical protein